MSGIDSGTGGCSSDGSACGQQPTALVPSAPGCVSIRVVYDSGTLYWAVLPEKSEQRPDSRQPLHQHLLLRRQIYRGRPPLHARTSTTQKIMAPTSCRSPLGTDRHHCGFYVIGALGGRRPNKLHRVSAQYPSSRSPAQSAYVVGQAAQDYRALPTGPTHLPKPANQVRMP